MLKLVRCSFINNNNPSKFLNIAMSTMEAKEEALKRSPSERGGLALNTVETWENYFQYRSEQLRPRKEKFKHLLGESSFGLAKDLNQKVSIFSGDITNLQIDAIVNAANKTLLGGGGVDGAIHRKAGSNLREECRLLNGCETGEAKITGGYKLPAKYIIHTVGPVGEKPDLLKSCYSNSLRLVLENKLKSVAFPCISTGVYGYPQAEAALVALTTVRKFLEENAGSVDRVIFCLFLKEDVDIYECLMQHFFPLE